MKQSKLTLNGKEVVIVEVPEGSKLHHIETTWVEEKPYLGYKFRDDLLANEYQNIMLPPGSYELVGSGLCSEITEAEAKGIIGEPHGYCGVAVYWNYTDGRNRFCATALDSLRSFVLANGYDPLKSVFLINKNK